MREFLTKIGMAAIEEFNGHLPEPIYDEQLIERVAAAVGRAAIEAIRNPTGEFLTYLQMAHDMRPEDWSDVIDTALAEPK